MGEMRITEFSIIPSEPLPRPRTDQRLAALNETLWNELRSRVVDVPIPGRAGKFVLRLRSPGPRETLRRPAVIGGNIEAEEFFDASAVHAPTSEFRRTVLDAAQRAVGGAEEKLGWSLRDLVDVVAEVRAKPDVVGLVELDWLRRRMRRDKADIRVFHRITDDDARTWLEVRWDDGLSAQREIRAEPHPEGLWVSFPAFSAKISAVDYSVFRKDGRLLWTVPIDELRALREGAQYADTSRD